MLLFFYFIFALEMDQSLTFRMVCGRSGELNGATAWRDLTLPTSHVLQLYNSGLLWNVTTLAAAYNLHGG